MECLSIPSAHPTCLPAAQWLLEGIARDLCGQVWASSDMSTRLDTELKRPPQRCSHGWKGNWGCGSEWDCQAERPAPPARRALPPSPHCVRSTAGLSGARHRTRTNPGARGGKDGRGGREKEQEETPKGHGASAVIQRILDLPASRFAAKRHQLESFLSRPTRVVFACGRWHAPCSFIYLLSLFPCLSLRASPPCLHISTTPSP